MNLFTIWMMNVRIGLILYKEAAEEWATKIINLFDSKKS